VTKTEAPTADLTPRERQVLELLASGLSTKQTAAQLGLSDKTVHAFRSRLMAKLGVRTLQELTKFAIRHGITSV
jgi:DNA-binding NarL/FixJ family response regulator